MTIWYSADTGRIEFFITDDAYADKHELKDMWRSPRAEGLERMRLERRPDRPMRQYKVENGELVLLSDEEMEAKRRIALRHG